MTEIQDKSTKVKKLKHRALLTDGFVCHIQHGANDVIFLPHFAERLGTHVPLAALQQFASSTRVINCDNLFDKTTATTTTKRCTPNRLTAVVRWAFSITGPSRWCGLILSYPLRGRDIFIIIIIIPHGEDGNRPQGPLCSRNNTKNIDYTTSE